MGLGWYIYIYIYNQLVFGVSYFIPFIAVTWAKKLSGAFGFWKPRLSAAETRLPTLQLPAKSLARPPQRRPLSYTSNDPETVDRSRWSTTQIQWFSHMFPYIPCSYGPKLPLINQEHLFSGGWDVFFWLLIEIITILIWLVVWTLWKIWLCQLGWWISQYYGK